MKRLLVLAPLLALLLAGQVAVASGGGAAQASGAKTVTIDHFEFKPHALGVAKGTTVVFANASGTAHTATDSGVFDTGRIKPGRSVSVRFKQKGTFSYHCKIHPFMHGKIVVG
jgi:plastocyanin